MTQKLDDKLAELLKDARQRMNEAKDDYCNTSMNDSENRNAYYRMGREAGVIVTINEVKKILKKFIVLDMPFNVIDGGKVPK